MFPQRLLGINGGSDLLRVLGLDAQGLMLLVCVCVCVCLCVQGSYGILGMNEWVYRESEEIIFKKGLLNVSHVGQPNQLSLVFREKNT